MKLSGSFFNLRSMNSRNTYEHWSPAFHCNSRLRWGFDFYRALVAAISIAIGARLSSCTKPGDAGATLLHKAYRHKVGKAQ